MGHPGRASGWPGRRRGSSTSSVKGTTPGGVPHRIHRAARTLKGPVTTGGRVSALLDPLPIRTAWDRVAMCTIAVNGTTPYYQRRGEGPTVMCIAGATGAPSAGTGTGRPSPGGGGRRCARRWCRARRDATLSPTPGREVTRDRGHGTAHLAADPAAATARRRSPCSQRLRTIQRPDAGLDPKTGIARGRLRRDMGARRRAARRADRRPHGKSAHLHQAIPNLFAEPVLAQWMEPM
jgi:hypothetical protein